MAESTTRKQKMRRVLIVTGGFPPSMAAEIHRARMLSYELPSMGWEVEILTLSPDYLPSVWIEPDSLVFRDKRVPVHESPSRFEAVFQAMRWRSVGLRAFWPVYRTGLDILKKGNVDMIFISTTLFHFFCLGRMWKRKTGIPYVCDYHDPWYRKPHYSGTKLRNWKSYAFAKLAKHLEKFALKHADGIVAVSPVYLDQLRFRYSQFRCVRTERSLVIPFGAAEQDFVIARATSDQPKRNDPGMVNIVYVGAGGSIMCESFRRVCQGLARLKRQYPPFFEKIQLCLFGTSAFWQSGDPLELQALAESEGVGELVEERPARISYLKAVKLALQADGLLILGVDDPAYMPSKLFLYAMTGKPLLASMHKESQVNDYFKRFPELGAIIHFAGSAEREVAEDKVLLEFLKQAADCKTFTRENIRTEFSAAAMARRHVELFERCISKKTEI
jgi:glycosyltransferase involved in cell wall biosynthesis